MNSEKLGTVLVSRSEARSVCEKAIENVRLYRNECTEKSVVHWMNRFNRKGILYRIRTILGYRPWELSYQETVKKLDLLCEKYADYGYYNYKSWAWSDTLGNAKTILNCCNSYILEPMTLEINIWDDLLFVSKLTVENIKEKASKFTPDGY